MSGDDSDAGKQSSKEEKKDKKNVSKQSNKKSIESDDSSDDEKKNKVKDKDVDQNKTFENSDEEDNANNSKPSSFSKKATLNSQKQGKMTIKDSNNKTTVPKDSNSHETVNSNDSLEEDPDAGINLISAHPDSKIAQRNKKSGMTNFSNDSSQPSRESEAKANDAVSKPKKHKSRSINTISFFMDLNHI